MSETPHIRLDALTKRFGSITAVSELSLTLKAGQIIGLLGPNGAGKTTTLHTIMGLKTPTTGDVRINRVSVHSPEIASVRRGIGYLPEQPVLYDYLTGREFIQFLGQLYDPALDLDDWLNDNLDALQMGQDADRLIRTYSMGMRKKTAFLAAMVHRPSILIFDEPTGALDAARRRRLHSGWLWQPDHRGRRNTARATADPGAGRLSASALPGRARQTSGHCHR